MMELLKSLKKMLDLTLDIVCGLLMAMLLVVVLWQVASRYAIKTPSPWTEELAGFLMIWLSLIGACAAFRRHAHLGIDFLTAKFDSSRKQFLLKSIAALCCALFSLLVLLAGGTELVWKTFLTNQTSATLGIKTGYVYLAVPISGFCITIYSLQDMFTFTAKYSEHLKTIRAGQ
ncbi:2,3-diketo-L-gulonate TRAP transporter small permease protein YiaM [Limihaloglobus sulfuriphilus]|uniref:2,3-diketo-L-gulonate TRAP transporter small permease protein YiaM n=1 Tax=Limihaloglobus sulfuriphilus TaxID=1851148 RepID=A0A1Q2ME08_9BACT|nr:TRAP transporter small permease [Limihaloglobus sulfuriphilus]AQQ70936.1 2,3-diketo-L-gulonate TRAP transporter small permease protein YiaM [Limihaloglobus sulfuriphilus]